MNIFHRRQGQTELHEVYFYTLTVVGFRHLLKYDAIKLIVLQSMIHLVNKKLLKVFGFVIMPNHIHLICSQMDKNGKEMPLTSFMKYTSHEFKKYLGSNYPEMLPHFASDKYDRRYQFWKRDPLAISLSSIEILEQKLDYIHNNPVIEKWSLAKTPEEYRWSSARFYLQNIDEFHFLTHCNE